VTAKTTALAEAEALIPRVPVPAIFQSSTHSPSDGPGKPIVGNGIGQGKGKEEKKREVGRSWIPKGIRRKWLEERTEEKVRNVIGRRSEVLWSIQS
jgi:hypothetical protein